MLFCVYVVTYSSVSVSIVILKPFCSDTRSFNQGNSMESERVPRPPRSNDLHMRFHVACVFLAKLHHAWRDAASILAFIVERVINKLIYISIYPELLVCNTLFAILSTFLWWDQSIECYARSRERPVQWQGRAMGRKAIGSWFSGRSCTGEWLVFVPRLLTSRVIRAENWRRIECHCRLWLATFYGRKTLAWTLVVELVSWVNW